MNQHMNEIPKEIDDNLKLLAKNIEINLHQLLESTNNITKRHIIDHEASWPIEKQYLKIYEEIGEAEKAYTRNLSNEQEEHMDILFALLTLHHQRKKSREENEAAILECLRKFHHKGWLY